MTYISICNDQFPGSPDANPQSGLVSMFCCTTLTVYIISSVISHEQIHRDERNRSRVITEGASATYGETFRNNLLCGHDRKVWKLTDNPGRKNLKVCLVIVNIVQILQRLTPLINIFFSLTMKKLQMEFDITICIIKFIVQLLKINKIHVYSICNMQY